MEAVESVVRDAFESAVCSHQRMLEDPILVREIARWAEVCAQTIRSGGTVFFAGNGGSFADAQHLAAEFTGRMLRDRGPLAGVALGTNSSSMSAIANDYGYDEVFTREIEALGRAGDVLVVLSTSGNSRNVIAAVEAATTKGLLCVALTGEASSLLSQTCETIRVPADRTDRIQELHILLGHVLCSTADDLLREPVD